ncbi:MAG: M24 family metallopeptidase [Pseudomonadota bacterium]|jgi:Xaa-Pro aminopeptidase|nr:M24 family metallopeptidase [Pseudomonadota bacterium]
MPATHRLPSISTDELRRRVELVRARLRTLKAGALVVFGSHNDLAGYLRWLTDCSLFYRRVVIVHSEDLMTVVEHGSAGEYRKLDGQQPGYVGVGEVYNVATFPSVHFTQDYEAKIVAKVLRRQGYRRIAVINGAGMPSGFFNTLDQGGTIEVIDDSEYFDGARALKSAEEQTRIRAAAHLQDEVFAALISQIKVGMRDLDVSALAEYEARRRGGHFGIVLTGSAPQGTPAFIRGDENQGRRIQVGDALSVLIENGSPDGYFVELSRTIVLGCAWPELRESLDEARRLQEFLIGLMHDGASCRGIDRRYRNYAAAEGVAVDRRLYAHGQGYDLVERPLIREDEPMTLACGMCLAVHPPALVGNSFASLCDNVLVTSGRPEPLHRTEKRIFELG